MSPDPTFRPVFGQPGWRRRIEDRHGWDKEFVTVGAILVFVLLSIGFVRADDAALPQDDPKDAQQQPDIPHCYTDAYFLPLPSWSHFVKMPELPAALTPMGGPVNKIKPSPAAVAETKPDQAPMPKKLPQPGPLATSATPAPAPSNKPELEAISPFLQWVHDHPQQAAAAARQESASYNAQPAGAMPAADPYWMPPMMDQPAPVGGNGSAAIYSTPQK